MDYDKLIEDLRVACAGNQHNIMGAAATAIETLHAKNEELREKVEDARLEGYAKGLGEMSEENEKLRADVVRFNDMLASYQNVLVPELRAELEYEKEHANAYYEECGQWEVENAQLKEKVEDLQRERDSIEQDFRAFAKQWWEEANGFPCQFCKFEHSGGCGQKAKHPDDEKPCAGRWFEWRGIKKD